jgi:hypothetical protein
MPARFCLFVDYGMFLGKICKRKSLKSGTTTIDEKHHH